MIGIGIDTGGTYTDAVVYDLMNKQVLSCGKSLTTKENLETGILNAIYKLSKDHLYKADFIALSTTLATNACVEGKGGRAKLMFIGVDPVSVESVLASYGLPSSEELYFLPGDPDHPEEQPDWDAFERDIPVHFSGYDSVAVVQIHPRSNNGEYEKKAYAILKAHLHIPCVLGYDLFHDLNVLRRGTSALLNARLLPVMKNFFDSIHSALEKLSLNLPIIVVRSDGSLMSQEFACERPVETLLCGPASSILGSMELTDEANGIVVDMGGTTSDIAMFKDNIPVTVKTGIQIGNWKTFVKGLYIDTFGLGGDSAVRYEGKSLYLDSGRVIPLCNLADRYPSILTDLNELIASERRHTRPLHEFYVLIKKPAAEHLYTEEELQFCKALENGPLILEQAASAIGKDLYTFQMSRLEQEGIVMRSGLTPTDIMHIRGDFSAFSKEASLAGAEFICHSLGLTMDELCEKVYALAVKKLYCNIGRILLQHQDPELFRSMNAKTLEIFLDRCYQQAVHKETASLLQFRLKAGYPLIGIGAPIHLFIKNVAELLETKSVVPEAAPVANALGATVGNVVAKWTTEIRPVYGPGGISGYEVYARNGILSFEELEDARIAAIAEAEEAAAEEAKKRGASGMLSASHEIKSKNADLDGFDLFLNEQIIAKAVGKIFTPEF